MDLIGCKRNDNWISSGEIIYTVLPVRQLLIIIIVIHYDNTGTFYELNIIIQVQIRNNNG